MKQLYDLGGSWKMRKAGDGEWLDATVPGSVYSNLLSLGKMEDPYYRENQEDVRDISRNDFEFSRTFDVPDSLRGTTKLFLQFDGLDTLADITLNGKWLGHADNMHRIWRYDVAELLKATGNELTVHFYSPILYMEKMEKHRQLGFPGCSIEGFSYLRKCHSMSGWDWAPQLPDMGIWRPVQLVAVQDARLDSVFVAQQHADGKVTLTVRAEAERFSEAKLTAHYTLCAPDGRVVHDTTAPVTNGADAVTFPINDPEIWWPNGYGKQPLYTLKTELLNGENVIDAKTQRIGLRTVTVSREKDEWGQEFCFVVNGKKIFGMGADYIPEDQILARINPDRTRKLLLESKEANFNLLRVWGGGYYPDDYFYDLCDEMGLLIWQDFMFACAIYEVTPEFRANCRQEFVENIKRIRSHACLGLFCGNNEMEVGWVYWNFPNKSDDLKEQYTDLFEKLLPELCGELAPQTFYWPSSPSSGGNFDEPNDYTRGDVHYWDVWHGMKPLTEFRKFYFRFCSEYGFESLPNIKTVRSFALPEDMNLTSAVIEAHHKCDDGPKKLLYYMSQAVPYPYTFEGVIYASQLLQADAIRSNVEHMRRNRVRCKGSVYWQLNDSNPIISWSSIDYFGRWKALHYYAKRFYAPVLVSANEQDPAAVVINVSNEQLCPVAGTVRWALRDNTAKVLKQGSCQARIDPLSSANCLTLDLSAELSTKEELRGRYLEYSFVDESGVTRSFGNSLFVPAKYFKFLKPGIRTDVCDSGEDYVITLRAAAYAKSVCLDLKDADCVFSDNWFDIHGDQPVTITVKKASLSRAMNRTEFMDQLTVFCSNDL